MAIAMKEVLEVKARSALCNDEEMFKMNKDMFEETDEKYAERTKHSEIAPPSVRILEKKKKGFGKLYEEKYA